MKHQHVAITQTKVAMDWLGMQIIEQPLQRRELAGSNELLRQQRPPSAIKLD
jgi:hypothetical protein